ncbi:hypothetical protein [Sporosarcina sp. D27]|uniref:hypothetical protein n=1 Tax=Sporosarcina sp. D27 TaxID=1382305 RepID=UPI0004719461|nr:hypothetical protein [Sporosarcina sp. D27]
MVGSVFVSGGNILKFEALFSNLSNDLYPDLVIESPQGTKYGYALTNPSIYPGGGSYNGYSLNPEIMTFNSPEAGTWKIWINNQPSTITSSFIVKHIVD